MVIAIMTAIATMMDIAATTMAMDRDK